MRDKKERCGLCEKMGRPEVSGGGMIVAGLSSMFVNARNLISFY